MPHKMFNKMPGFLQDQILNRGPTKFTLFSDFPPEIQDKVWAAAVALEPRRLITVDVDYSCTKHEPEAIDQYGNEYPDFDHRLFILSGKTSKNSPLLRTCQRSRVQALKVYILAFGNIFKTPIYTNFLKDTLLFKSNFAMTQIRWDLDTTSQLAQISALAVQTASTTDTDIFPTPAALFNVFKGFRGVRLAVLVDPRPDGKNFATTGRRLRYGGQKGLQDYVFPIQARQSVEFDQPVPYLVLMTTEKFREWIRDY